MNAIECDNCVVECVSLIVECEMKWNKRVVIQMTSKQVLRDDLNARQGSKIKTPFDLESFESYSKLLK